MDDICQEQFMELSYLNGGQEHGARGRGGMPIRGRGVLPGGAHRCADPWKYLISYNNCCVTERAPTFTKHGGVNQEITLCIRNVILQLEC